MVVVSLPYFEEKYLFCYTILKDQISLPDCLYFLRHWAINALQLSVIQSVKSLILKLSLAFLSSCFPAGPKSQGKNVNILNEKRAFNMK